MTDLRTPEQHFVQTFHLLVNSTRIHQDNNKTLMFAVDRFVQIIGQLCLEDNEATLLFSEENFYLNEKKIVSDRFTTTFSTVMLQYFEERELEGLRFHDSISEAPLSEITGFFRILNSADQQDDPSNWLEGKIDENNFAWVEHIRVSQASTPPEQKAQTASASKKRKDEGTQEQEEASAEGGGLVSADKESVAEAVQKLKKKQNAVQTYGYAVLSLQDIAKKVSSNKQASIKRSKRLIQNMIDMVVDDDQMFISLSTIRDYDDYTYTHSINVSILSIALGRKIGLSKSALEVLGMGALFHDLGKIDVPIEILNKPGKLTDEEFTKMKKHALDSVRRIIKLRTSRRKKAQLLLPPFEHHLKYDLSGYPQTPRKKPLSLFGRIICIADVFDALTAARVYRPNPWSPDKALGMMLEQGGRDFDPILIKIFANMVGVYPIGTVLKFEDDEMGLVAYYSGEDNEKKELWVQMLETTESGSFYQGPLVSLGPWNQETSSFDRKVVESIHPSALGIQPAEFIM